MVKYQPDMSQQNYSQDGANSSFDGELEVLAAIYQKKPELLRPDQVKKLMDSGILDSNSGAGDVQVSDRDSRAKDKNVIDQSVLEKAFDEADAILLETDRLKHHYYSDEDWDQMSEDKKFEARERMFEDNFQMSPVDLAYSIYHQLSQGSQHA